MERVMKRGMNGYVERVARERMRKVEIYGKKWKGEGGKKEEDKSSASE